MCLFLEMLWVTKCRYLSVGGGEIFPYHSEYFSHPKNLELLFRSTAFVDKIIRGNIIYNLYLSASGQYGKIFAEKGKGMRK